MIFSLYIINKAGGLIYQNDFSSIPKLAANDYLRLAGIFHGLHAITSSLSPNGPSSGIELLEADTFKLQCYQTATNIKFFVTADPSHPNLDQVLHNVYELFADYVLKNPFYEMEMPIRCDLFDINLDKLFQAENRLH
eukprot:TRINITY_DN11313_c0_g1_i1.p1 TRINITY_DN11313_c0_g1~~TRINITY_DN11313_c0_g1_i1.p1  ORF type:complete len:137 (+),score=23.20 TRINITY_DN11313_c0_g1_i1:156-566(+)